jgi:phage terminase small subunit
VSRELTFKQENFCKEYIKNGGNASEAYRKSYNCKNSSDKSVWEAASKLLKNAKVAPRIAALRKEISDAFVWDRVDSLLLLAKVARDTTDRTSSRITAIKTINDMQGYTAPTKNKHVFANPDGTPLQYNVVTNYVAPGDLDK